MGCAAADIRRVYCQSLGTLPRAILLANHGVITLGSSPQAVMAAMLMADKAARVFAGAAALGGPEFLNAVDVDRIANRVDEHHRQRAPALGLDGEMPLAKAAKDAKGEKK